MKGAQGFYRKTISHIYERDKERFAMCMERMNVSQILILPCQSIDSVQLH